MQRHGCLQAMAWAAFNGVGLAFVLPCAQSILADYYIPEQRGRAFGFMFTLAALGEPLGCMTRYYPRMQELYPSIVTRSRHTVPSKD